MENLRAFMVITALQEMDIPFLVYPADVESNSDTIDFIQEHGFYVCPESRELTEVAVNVIKEINSVSTLKSLITLRRLRRQKTQRKSQKNR